MKIIYNISLPQKIEKDKLETIVEKYMFTNCIKSYNTIFEEGDEVIYIIDSDEEEQTRRGIIKSFSIGSGHNPINHFIKN